MKAEYSDKLVKIGERFARVYDERSGVRSAGSDARRCGTLIVGCGYAAVGYAVGCGDALICEEGQIADTQLYLPMPCFSRSEYEPVTDEGQRLRNIFRELGLFKNGMQDLNGFEIGLCSYLTEARIVLMLKTGVVEITDCHGTVVGPARLVLPKAGVVRDRLWMASSEHMTVAEDDGERRRGAVGVDEKSARGSAHCESNKSLSEDMAVAEDDGERRRGADGILEISGEGPYTVTMISNEGLAQVTVGRIVDCGSFEGKDSWYTVLYCTDEPLADEAKLREVFCGCDIEPAFYSGRYAIHIPVCGYDENTVKVYVHDKWRSAGISGSILYMAPVLYSRDTVGSLRDGAYGDPIRAFEVGYTLGRRSRG